MCKERGCYKCFYDDGGHSVTLPGADYHVYQKVLIYSGNFAMFCSAHISLDNGRVSELSN